MAHIREELGLAPAGRLDLKALRANDLSLPRSGRKERRASICRHEKQKHHEKARCLELGQGGVDPRKLVRLRGHKHIPVRPERNGGHGELTSKAAHRIEPFTGDRCPGYLNGTWY